MSTKLQNFLRKVASYAMISHATVAKSAEEIALHELAHKAAQDEVLPTVDALIKVGLVKHEQRKTAAANLSSHAEALIKLRKVAEMISKEQDEVTVGGPGRAMPKTAGDRIRIGRDEANDEFVESQQ